MRTKHVCSSLRDHWFTQESQSGEFKTKWGIWKYLKVSPRNSRLHKYSHWFQMAAALLKPTLHLHTSKACVLQNMVLHRHCTTPNTRERFFYKDASLHHQCIPTHPTYTLLFTQRQQEVWAYCLVLARDGKPFGGETKIVMFYLGDTCWLDLSISTSPLLSHMGNKR